MIAKIADIPNMSPKRGNKDFYKGKGGTSQGRITSKGRFIQIPTKMKFILAPLQKDLSSFPLKPYVSKKTPVQSKLITMPTTNKQ